MSIAIKPDTQNCKDEKGQFTTSRGTQCLRNTEMSQNKPLLYYFVSYGNIRTKAVYIGLTISVFHISTYSFVFTTH